MKCKGMTIIRTSFACSSILIAGLVPVAAHSLDFTGVYADETEIRLPVDTGSAARSGVGDIDGDGDIDIIVPCGAYTGFPVPEQDFLLQVNDGSGGFTDEADTRLPSTALSTQYAAAAVFGDVDGDRDLDIFVANGTSLVSPNTPDDWQNRLWINDGSGVFSDETSTRLPAVSDSSFYASIGDVDGDEDLDIVVGNVGQQNTLLINEGDGVFVDETSSRLPGNADVTLAVALKDLDGDSDLDLIVANRSWYNSSKILINDGSGVFSDESSLRFLPYPPSAGDIRVVDANGDGLVDIMFSSVQGGALIYIGTEGGIFVDESADRMPVYSNAEGLAVADVDRDGDYDAFVTLPGEHSVLLLLNDGNGFFTDSTSTNLPELFDAVRYPACGDVDNDGDADFYLGVTFNDSTNNQDRMLINLGSPITLIEDLADETSALNLARGVERALLSKLNKALDKLTNEKSKDDAIALRLLNDYVVVVDAKTGKQIAPEDAEILIGSANAIISRLSLPAECI